MHTLIDEDGNSYNVELKIKNNKLLATDVTDADAGDIEVNLEMDMVDIRLKS